MLIFLIAVNGKIPLVPVMSEKLLRQFARLCPEKF
jgi:hypothetical protein